MFFDHVWVDNSQRIDSTYVCMTRVPFVLCSLVHYLLKHILLLMVYVGTECHVPVNYALTMELLKNIHPKWSQSGYVFDLKHIDLPNGSLNCSDIIQG